MSFFTCPIKNGAQTLLIAQKSKVRHQISLRLILKIVINFVQTFLKKVIAVQIGQRNYGSSWKELHEISAVTGCFQFICVPRFKWGMYLVKVAILRTVVPRAGV